MTSYYLSRALISLGFGAFFVLTGSPWWMAILFAGVAFGFFLWAPHGGRYVAHPEAGVTAMQRDERTQAIADKAARNAFVVLAFSVAGIVIYFGMYARTSVPVTVLNLTLVLAGLVYAVSDFWLRRL
jgi:hypothetical protein